MRTATAILLASLALVVGCSTGPGAGSGGGVRLTLGGSAGSPRNETASCPHSTPACEGCRAKTGRAEPHAGLTLAIEEDDDPPPTSFNVDHKDPSAPPKQAEPKKPLKKVRITVAHTPGLGEFDQEDEGTWQALADMMKQFGFELVLNRDPKKSQIKPTKGRSVATDMETGEDQYNFGALIQDNFPDDPRGKKATNRFDFFLVITDYVRAGGEFRIGYDFDQGVAMAAGSEPRIWHGGPITPESHQAKYYRSEDSRGRAILLFHEIVHHVCGGLDQHETGGLMAKCSPKTELYVGPTYAEAIEKAGGKSVADLKKDGLCKDAQLVK